MKNKLTSKKIMLFILAIVILFLGSKIIWGIYQAENTNIISIEDITEVNLSSKQVLSGETEVSGAVKIGDFEEVSHINKESVDNVLYIIIHKQPSFSKENTFSFTLDDVKDIDSINKISIVSGDVYTGEGAERGYSLRDLKKLPEQEIVWEQYSK